MKKKAFYVAEVWLVLFTILILGGCGSRIDYSLPANPIEFSGPMSRFVINALKQKVFCS